MRATAHAIRRGDRVAAALIGPAHRTDVAAVAADVAARTHAATRLATTLAPAMPTSDQEATR